MCLMVKPGYCPEIAKEDITCWKMVVDWDKTRWVAPFMRTFHEYGKELTGCERLKVENWGRSDGRIDKGFHGYISREEAEDNIPNDQYYGYTKGWKVTECVIPKGAEYCMGMYNEIVANKIIVHKPKCVK